MRKNQKPDFLKRQPKSGFSLVNRWLALTLTVWLAYILARALWTMVALGTPFFDWQWYLACLLFVLSLPIRILFRLRRNRALNLILARLGLRRFYFV